MILSETEDELVLRIPLVRRLRPVVVQPQPIVIVFKVEDVQVPVGIGLCEVPSESLPTQIGVWLYFMRDRESPSASHQVFLFNDKLHILSAKP